MTRRPLVSAFAGVLLVAGCGVRGPAEPVVETQEPVPVPAPPEPPGVAPTAEALESGLAPPTPGMPDVRQVAWDQASAGPAS